MAKVNKKDKVTVYGTGLGNLAEGKSYPVHKIVAAKLEEKGYATKEKPDGKSKKGDK